MSISDLVRSRITNVYCKLPYTIGITSLSTAISYLAARTIKPVDFPNPLVVAKVTASITLVQLLDITFLKALNSTNRLHQYSALLASTYGINILLNPDRSYQAAFKLGTLIYVSKELYKKVFSSYVLSFFANFYDYQMGDRSFKSVAHNAVKKIYREFPQTIVATLAAGLLSRSINSIGLNPKTAMIFTVTTAALRGLNPFIKRYCINSWNPNNLTNLILISGLTLGSKHYTHLDLPGFATLVKGYGIGLLTIEASARLIKLVSN